MGKRSVKETTRIKGRLAGAGLALTFPLALSLTWQESPGLQRASAPRPGAVAAPAGSPTLPRTSRLDTPSPATVKATLSGLPLYFIENHGQVDPRFAYYVEGSETSAYFAQEGVTFVLTGSTEEAEGTETGPREAALAAKKSWGVTLEFEGANPDARPTAQEKSAAVVSYFRGARDEWKRGLPTYKSLAYRDLWPGIDLVYSGTATRIKYTFVVQPGADPDQIRLVYRGASSVKLTEDGSLKVSTPVGGFEDDTPFAYQEGAGEQEPVEVAFAPDAESPADACRYGFRVGPYDRSRPLILDPVVLAFAGYIGGTAGTAALEERADAVAVDSNGDIYIAGSTPSNSLAGPLDGQFPTGSAWIGPGGPGQANWTDGGGTDLCSPSVLSCRTSYNGPGAGGTGTDAFVAKVKGDGSEFIYVVYLGGTCDTDNTFCRDYAHAIAVDSAGSAYVAGRTNSTEANGFPVSGAADTYFRRTHSGTYSGTISDGFDGFVCKISDDAVRGPGSDLDYCGYIGGTDEDEIRGIAVDSAGAAYVVGSTGSNEKTTGPVKGEFPVKVGPDLTYNDTTPGNDVFVAKVQATGVSLDYCGYLGGTDGDTGWGIAVDASGNAYITGYTQSDESTENLPTQVGPDLTFNGTVGAAGPGDAFVAKVKANPVDDTASGGSLGFDYVGYVGGAQVDWGYGIDVDDAGNAYVVGETASDETTFPVLVGPDLTINNLCCTPDAFVAKVQANPVDNQGSGGNPGLDYAGYIGGAQNDTGRAIAVDAATGEAYVTGYTQSDETTFPVLQGPELTHDALDEAFVAKVQANPVDNQGSGGNPGLDYAGYIGGDYVDRAYGIALDPSGDVFVVGTTSSREDPACGNFPAQNFVDNTFNSLVACLSTERDAFVAKIAGGPKRLYRSVGINSGNLNTGGRTVEITGSTAIFSGPMPNNVGVGDVLAYVSGGNRLAFIVGRSSSTTFAVADKVGAPPTAALPTTSVTVYRAYNALADWESGIENPNIPEPTEDDVNPSMDLVTANTVMMVACYADGEDVGSVYINSWETGPDNYIRIYTPVFPSEVGASQRHNGAWDTSAYRLAQDASAFAVIRVRERYVRIDGLQLTSNQIVLTESNGIHVGDGNGDAPVEIHISNNIVRTTTAALPDVAFGIGALSGFGSTTSDSSLYLAKVWNNIVYGYVAATSSTGIYANQYGTMYAYNNTVVGTGPATHRGIAQFNSAVVHAKNNISIDSANPYWGTYTGSTNNFSDLNDAPGLNPKTRDGAGADPLFVGGVDYHLDPSDTWAQDQGADLSSDADLAFAYDIDLGTRQTPWDIGADDVLATTAVKLLSFDAVPADGAVALEWRTASELDNLGFHLYRSLSEPGPWTRITPSLVPGLGSSPVGASYSWSDTGLVNGTRYFYRLEDIDTSSVSTFHGPVSAVPQAGLPPEGGSEGTGGGDGSAVADDVSTYGDPAAVSVRVVSRTSRSAVVELRTGGFSLTRDSSGAVRASIPGFDLPTDPRAPALPLKRVVLDALVGRKVRLGAVEAEDLAHYPGLTPAAVGYPEIEAGADGTVRPSRREAFLRDAGRGYLPRDLARLAGVAFQGERKTLALELSPLRYDVERGQLVLARRLLVRVEFVGREPEETGSGHRGRRRPEGRKSAGETLSVLYTSQKGLHAVPFEALFPGRKRPLSLSSLGLERQGEAVPFHVEPASGTFGPGGVLFFYADRVASSTAFTSEVAWELVRTSGGVQMATASVSPVGSLLLSPSWGRGEWEVNQYYQAGLLDAKDPWLWQAALGGVSRSVGFELEGLERSSPGRLSVFLQGGSDVEGVVDHHVRVLVNGSFVGETRFGGKLPQLLEADLPASVLREGENTLTVENVGDTGVHSLVFLDRFSVEFAQTSALRAGRFEGRWSQSGVAEIAGAPSLVAVDVTDPLSPVWLTGLERTPSGVRLRAEAGRRYVVASSEGTFVPRVVSPVRSTLEDPTNQADYILIAPEAFLPVAQPLLERRQAQGLTTKAASLEEIASVFGHGEESAEAIQRFLAHAFHSWTPPSPRYALLLGDASYDPRNFSGRSEPAPLPALWIKTAYLWTASDPSLAAVNGEDPLPDLAIGRLPATSLGEAQALVAKILDWEDSHQGLSGAAILVADNPDIAGDFEANIEDIRASFLSGRATTTIKIRELGGLARSTILDAFNRGASLVSYVGHGGTAVWASENVLNSWDAASLQAQTEQPLMLTLDCLNGYFVVPTFDSLSEAFLKSEGRGTIAAFSPSGLSVDGPAHIFHRSLMAEIVSGDHERLGDAILAAQQAYAETGLLPELVSIYHLLGDPGMKIR